MDPSNILLTDQVAIVTGGGQGIGEGIALAFARFGADVVIADKNAETAAQVADSVGRLGRRGLSIQTDVRELEQVEAMVSQTVAELGRVDILVNNAGGVRNSPFLDLGQRQEREPGAIYDGDSKLRRRHRAHLLDPPRLDGAVFRPGHGPGHHHRGSVSHLPASWGREHRLRRQRRALLIP